MKKISKICLENSRAYYNEIIFDLPDGKNLLLYGENGSGKTSLYKGLSDFIQSFYSPVTYTPNWNKPAGSPGHVTLQIEDYDDTTGHLHNPISLSFTQGSDNTVVPDTAYLKALCLSKGFLNYKDLLKVYLYDDNNPNLFDLFVLNLLKNLIPLSHGWTKSLSTEWLDLNEDLFRVNTRKELRHRRGLLRLHDFETMLAAVLTDLFAEVNNYLSTYFTDFSLNVNFQLKPMIFKYGRCKRDWRIDQELKLQIQIGESPVGAYNEGLNEARLSAIAICLYLAALRGNPGGELHLMFLDDIFIGIDSANRYPILEILHDNFSDFQIIIATYDRSWYYLAKNYFIRHDPDKWKFCNLFTLPKQDNDKSFMIPVKVDGTSSFDRAKEYLHGRRDIDLPAAANYFRKAIEELLSENYLPKELFLNEDYTPIPGFKLTKRLHSLRELFGLIGMDTTHIHIIQSYLHSLIHPLSHYEEEAQIYRVELVKVEHSISDLFAQIKTFSKKCRLVLATGNKVIIHYSQADGSYCAKYHILLKDSIWLYKDPAGFPRFTDSKCQMVYMEGRENGIDLRPYHPKANDSKFKYASLDNALCEIYDYETKVNHHKVTSHYDYDIVSVVKNGGALECLTNRRNSLLSKLQ